MSKPRVVVVGAGVNGLVAANYLLRAGCDVTIVEREAVAGGACVSAVADIDGVQQHYALGASVLGLMQDFVFRDTGLAELLDTYVPAHAKLVHFPGDDAPTWIHRDPDRLDREFEQRWGERGDVAAFRADEARVVDFLQEGYRAARPPSLADAESALGKTLAQLWIAGSARTLLDHYLTAERSKVYMAMTVTESGPVSLFAPYSAFTLPLMDSGSIFGGYYGFVKGGIWQITETLARLNVELGATLHLDSLVKNIDADEGSLCFTKHGETLTANFDYLVFGTDPLTVSRLIGDDRNSLRVGRQKLRGSSGKLNLMFRHPVRWRFGSDAADSDAAFRFLFFVDTVDDFERATLRVIEDGVDYVPGYMQIYCEGAAMRHLGMTEPFDRLAVFFKNLSLDNHGRALADLEERLKQDVLRFVENPEDCAWSRLLTPRDLRHRFHFPGGNLDHTMLIGGQTFFDRNYSDDPARHFYRYAGHDNVYLCGSGTYPCGSVTGTPGYMCSQQLLRELH